MAKILMFGNQKGGVGKTLTGVMTATALGQAPFNLKVAVLDIDDQKSVTYARQIDIQSYPEGTPTPFDVLNYSIADLQKDIARLDAAYDILIIDVAGKLDVNADVTQQEVTKALMYVDVLFVPFVAGSYVFTATYNYLNFVREVQAARALQSRQLQVLGFVNMYRSRSRVNQMLLEHIETLAADGSLRMMQTYLNDYTLFKEADTISSLYLPTNSEAAHQNFCEWLYELVAVIQSR
jgi:cellulose biosynthesis protein BcsQ